MEMRFSAMRGPAQRLVVGATMVVAALGMGASARAQQSAPTSADARDGTVVVLVHDSLAGRPLAGASVQLVSAASPLEFSRSGETDSLGAVTFRDIPAGRYNVGFLHPTLDAMGVTAPVRAVQVEEGRSARAELAVPSATRLRAAICGPATAADSNAAVVGTVRNPGDLMPLPGAKVSAEWLEITFSSEGIRQRPTGITATTGPNGWFALCGLPAGNVTLVAGDGRDSTPALDLLLGAGELRLRDMYVAVPGTGQLSGRVVAVDSVRPLPRVRVSIVGGPQTETNARGEWSLAGVPLGTRMMEVRAIGYYPERRPVDVIAGAPPTEVALNTFQAVLDAVLVTASRNSPAEQGGFNQRMRGSGMGRFLPADRIARYNPINLSDLFRTLPGFIGDGSLTMKSNFSDGGGNFGVSCTPEVYVDGNYLPSITASEIDGLIPVENVAGIEVYSAGSPKPAQFDSGMSGCGSLVIWQKPPLERMRRRRE